MHTQEHTTEMNRIQGRAIAALLNPRAAVLVTCCDAQGAANVLTIAWHTPLSHNPPLVGIAVNRLRRSHAMISEGGEFVLNVVSMEFQEAVEYCGTHSGDANKFLAAGLIALPAAFVRPPLIRGALAHLECNCVNQVETGDHTFFIGRVVHAEAREDCFADRWQPETGDVLLCLQRQQYGTWSE